MIFGLLFPQWPSPREMEKMSIRGRAQWGLLFLLQTAGIALSAILLFLP